MLLIKTTVKPSNIAGMGLFADAYIAKGTEVFTFNDQTEKIISKEILAEMEEKKQQEVLNFSFSHPENRNLYVYLTDNAKYTNHSPNPNLGCIDGKYVALRAIQPGEECTEDYTTYMDSVADQHHLYFISLPSYTNDV